MTSLGKERCRRSAYVSWSRAKDYSAETQGFIGAQATPGGTKHQTPTAFIAMPYLIGAIWMFGVKSISGILWVYAQME